MAAENDKDKWDFVEKHLVKKEQELPQATSNALTAPLAGEVPQTQGIIERLKVNKIERNQRIQMLTEKTAGQLEVFKHYVEGQVVVAKGRIDLHVEAQLAEIGRQHLLNLQEIGISNFEDRMRVSQQLAVRTAEQITKIQAMDVPPTMKTQLIDAAVKGYQQLFEKIQSEEIRSPRKD